MIDLPDELRAHLERCYEDAEQLGLDPEWVEGEHGFMYDCPACQNEGIEHRCKFSFELRLLAIEVPNSATGPAG